MPAARADFVIARLPFHGTNQMLLLRSLLLRGLAVRVHSAAHPSPQGNVPVHSPALVFRPLPDVLMPSILHTQSS